MFEFAEPGKKKVLQYATICSNAGFMGNPIIEGIYGQEGLLYASGCIFVSTLLSLLTIPALSVLMQVI